MHPLPVDSVDNLTAVMPAAAALLNVESVESGLYILHLTTVAKNRTNEWNVLRIV